jgi:hypothetical protein
MGWGAAGGVGVVAALALAGVSTLAALLIIVGGKVGAVEWALAVIGARVSERIVGVIRAIVALSGIRRLHVTSADGAFMDKEGEHLEGREGSGIRGGGESGGESVESSDEEVFGCAWRSTEEVDAFSDNRAAVDDTGRIVREELQSRERELDALVDDEEPSL